MEKEAGFAGKFFLVVAVLGISLGVIFGLSLLTDLDLKPTGLVVSNTTTDVFEHSWFRDSTILDVAYDSDHDLVYFVGGGYEGPVFGVYNRTSGVLEDLGTTDPGNWMGSS
jgi:hypothetical protein